MIIIKINKKNFIGKKNKGDTLVETLFYIALFAVLSIAVINSMITMMKSFKETAIQRELAQGANIMERISREIRGASSVSFTNSNDIILTETGKTLEFKMSVGTNYIQLIDTPTSGSPTIANLNPSNVAVSGLTFTQITTAKGVAVKVFLTIYSNHDTSSRTENFYDTIVLRGDY